MSDNIKLCSDRKYRWIYEFPMTKNPTLIFTVLKVLFIAGIFPVLVVLFSEIGSEGWGAFLSAFKVLVIMALIFIPLSFIAYLIVAGIYGWKYIVIFEMSEDGIRHIQQPKQFKKAEGIAWLTVVAGATSNNPGRVGQGLLMASQNEMDSSFNLVKKVTGARRRNTIYLDQPLAHNQIYVENEDYDFVWQYITSRCVNAKICD